MPKGDGTGPPKGMLSRAGRMGGTRQGSGPGGYCLCPGCGAKTPHTVGTPCNSINCPECGTRMTKG